jgi:hypothetical protein
VLSVVCWKLRRDGQTMFGPEYVNRLRAARERRLQLTHELVCVTDDAAGLDGDVRIVPMPTTYASTPRCRRRMQIFSREFAREHRFGRRILSIDLDVVIVGDLTPLLSREEPLVCWKVAHAQVYSGSFLLMHAGVLDGLWQRFAADPEGYPRSIQPRGVPSDQAMLNAYLRGTVVPHWTEADGFVTYYGAGYERLEHLGVGPRRQELPPGARIVVLGSADKAVMDEGRYAWVREHWSALPASHSEMGDLR